MDNIILLFLALGIVNGLSPIFAGVEIALLINAKKSIHVIWFVIGALLMNLIGAEAFYCCAFFFMKILLAKMHTLGPEVRMVADMLLGVCLLAFAVVKFRQRKGTGSAPKPRIRKSTKRWEFFVDGVALQLVLFPFSLLLFVFITKLAYTHPNFIVGLLVVLAFCVLASAPLVLIIVFFKRYRAAIEQFLQLVMRWMDRANSIVVPIVSGCVGLYLIIYTIVKW